MTYLTTTPAVRRVLPPAERDRIRDEAAAAGVTIVSLSADYGRGPFRANIMWGPIDRASGVAATPIDAWHIALAKVPR